MGLLSDLNTTQWVMISVPMVALWVFLICAMESNGERRPLIGLIFGPLFIPLLVVMTPLLAVGLVMNGVQRRRPLVIVAGIGLLLLLAGYVTGIVLVGGRPSPVPADLPVERER